MSKYGRSNGEWDQLMDAGLKFLIEQARLQKTTSYTELDAVLRRRTGLRGFDFDLDSERAAMGHLLGLIVDQNEPTAHLMISALVIYLNENDAGPGFYSYAQQLGYLAPNASKSQKEQFWVQQVSAAHAHYR
jgi:hypothetical protein